MPKIPKNKMVSKQCPKCEQQVPVACKACPCGHIFFIARRPVSIHKTGGDNSLDTVSDVKRRRTERIKRERPDFYNAMEIESQLRKLHRRSRQHKSSTSTNASAADVEECLEDEQTSRKKRGRPKIGPSKERKSESGEQEEAFANIPQAKAHQYAVILAEINCKLATTQAKF